MSVVTLTLCELEDAGIDGLESFSPFCLKVHRALRVAGLVYERRHAQRPDAWKSLNPAKQVPVLLIGDRPVADSTEIVHAIEELAPGSLIPKRSRGEVMLWEDFADTALNGFVVASRWADDRNWPLVKEHYFASMPKIVRAIVPNRIRKGVIQNLIARDVWRAGAERCWLRFGRTLNDLDARAPEKGFWLGDAITAADVAIFAQLHSLRNDLTSWQRDEIQKRVRLVAYLDRVHARTAS